MKKIFFSFLLLLGAISASAVDFLVQTGNTGAPTWDQAVATATGATIVDLAASSTTIDAWLAANAGGKETWLTGGTYTFAASCANVANTTLYGGFAGTETSVSQRAKGANAWDFTNETIFDANGVWMFSYKGAANQHFDGLTLKNSVNSAHIGTFRPGNNSVINQCKFINNKTTNASGQGGALMFYNANATVSDCYFEGNEGGQGGALYVNCTSNTYSVTVTGCYFKDNFVHSTSTAANSGGAVHFQNAGVYTIDACQFVGNHIDNAKNGGAVSFAGTNDNNSITNCVFFANTGSQAAAYVAAGNVINNTFAENEGGALYATKGVFTNNVFWGTTAAKAGLAVSSANNTLDHNATVVAIAADANAILLDSVNNGTEAGVNYPKFTDVATGNLLPLDATSALVNAGIAVSTITTDVRGFLRTDGQLDLGAYELGAQAPTPSFKLTLVVGAHGQVVDVATGSAALDSYTLEEGATMSFSIAADSLYRIASVVYNNVNVTADLVDGVFTIPAIDQNSTLEVNFEVVLGSLLVESNHMELLSYNGAAVSALYEDLTLGTTLTFDYTLPQYYSLSSVRHNGVNITATATDTTIITSPIVGNDTLSIQFEYREPLIDENSTVVYVKVGGNGDGSTWATAMGDIQAAIREAKYDVNNVKTVWIAAGTYTPTATINIADSVSVYGGFAGTETDINQRVKGANAWDFVNETVISGSDQIQIMYCGKAELVQPIVLDGITFTHGYASDASKAAGGAMKIGKNVSVENCKILANTCDRVTGNGGAAGIQVYPGGDVYNCYFSGNHQTAGKNGGGAININTSSNGFEVHISNCVFTGNTSNVRGAGMNVQGQSPSYISNCVFYNNRVYGNDVNPGGAIYDNSNNQTTMINNVIYNNSGTSVCYLKPKKFANNTVVRNEGSVYIASGTNTTEFINNIVWACATTASGQTPTSVGGVAVSDMKVMYNFTYNPISTENNWQLSDDETVANTNKQFVSNTTNGDAIVADTVDTGDKLISGPKFRKLPSFFGAVPTELSDEDAAIFIEELDSADFQLTNLSPLVNSALDLEYVEEDCLGVSRPQGPRADVGAYELPYFDLVIDSFEATQGSVYDELGVALEGGTILTQASGQEISLYFFSADGYVLNSLKTTTSLDGGLTFNGITTDVTAEVDEDGKWTVSLTQPLLVSVEWQEIPSDLSNVQTDGLLIRKELRNGQIVIIIGEQMFDTLGRELK